MTFFFFSFKQFYYNDLLFWLLPVMTNFCCFIDKKLYPIPTKVNKQIPLIALHCKLCLEYLYNTTISPVFRCGSQELLLFYFFLNKQVILTLNFRVTTHAMDKPFCFVFSVL